MHYRLETNDWNTISAVFHGDEYRLPRGLSGLALDIGAYIGPVSVALALDNPDLDITAVEPVPDNLRLLRLNLETNGLAQRVQVIPAACGGPDQETATIRWGFTGSEVAEHHAFVGNSSLYTTHATGFESAEIPAFPLSALAPGPVAWLKIDVEGAEYAILTDRAVARCDVITGEYHPETPFGGTGGRQDILRLLGETHHVSFTGPVRGPGGFRAERR